MKTRQFQLQFHTPAFLGDATQSARWRTPPFKAQLRQWWRIAYAAQQRFAVNVGEMRDIEGRLFGHAWLESDSFERDGKAVNTAARKSEVRIRLSRWDEGQLKSWQAAAKVKHEEVGMVDSHLYMGYGPVLLPRGSREPGLKANAAIQAKEYAQLAIAFPDAHSQTLLYALYLMNLYGTVGGRSRNGWGSYSLTGIDGESHVLPAQTLEKCLTVDWPHALGTDMQGPLVWQTQAAKDWAALMRTLAEIKINLRTQPAFKFPHAQPDGQIHDRHWLSYPITRHDVTDWKRKNLRLPNQLRFKVRPTAEGQLVGVIFHMPHLPPADFPAVAKDLELIWRRVHNHLDQNTSLTRIAA